MGKLFIGHYGHPPEAESATLALRDCHQRLGLRPSDFVSAETPEFFKKKHGAVGKYLVFQLDAEESKDTAAWRPGYYLLPLEAADILKIFDKRELARGGAIKRPFDLQSERPPPADVMERANRWADQSQPLLFQCQCPQLLLRLDPPTLMRRHWKARLGCEKRCQPALKSRI